LVAVTTGVVGAAVVRVGVGAAVRVAVREGVAVGRAAAVVRLAVGEPPAVETVVAGVVVPPSGEGMSLPEGAGPAAWVPPGTSPSTWCSSPLTWESSPEDAATAPTVSAADEASSPVRTGWCRRLPRWLVGPGCGAAGSA
jgi:hypothetical protein